MSGVSGTPAPSDATERSLHIGRKVMLVDDDCDTLIAAVACVRNERGALARTERAARPTSAGVIRRARDSVGFGAVPLDFRPSPSP
jgi:hypothetical protein